MTHEWVHVGDVLRLLFCVVLLWAAVLEVGAAVATRAAERERRRIARDLHDGVAQELAFIRRRAVAHDAPDIVVAAERALLDSRWAIDHLSRAPEESLDRVLARHAAVIAARTDVAVTFSTTGSAVVGPEVSEALARILGEAVANARHGNATRVHVVLSTDPLRMSVIDDGAGFDPAASGDLGFGFGGMRERAALVGAAAERPLRSRCRDRGGCGAQMNRRARVLVADDHAPTREDIRAAIEADERFTVVAVAGDAAGAVQAAVRERPDVALLDMRMPGSGAAAAWEITARLPDTRAVMLTISRADEDLFAALRAGASGYLLKTMPFDTIGDQLIEVLGGHVAMPPELVSRLVEEFRDSAPRRRTLLNRNAGAQLTSREWQVLDYLRQGLATGEIARRLFVSPATVRSHVAAVLRKLRVPDREAAVRLFEDSA